MKAYKITRNEPCPCGSGKKYKKCCLGQDKVERIEKNYWDTNPSPIKEQKNVLIVTTTKEVAMPIRLYYKVHDKLTLIKCLDRLKCICWLTENHFLINYMKEAKNIGLMVKYSKVPPELYPIILADGHI